LSGAAKIGEAKVRLSSATLAVLLFSPAALAEVKTSAPDALLTEHRAEVAMTKEALWSRLIRPELWWSADHTYSHSAANLSLKPVAGGCWCESWKGGTVEHGRVIAVLPNQLLRLDTALGPLQELGVKGALTFQIIDAKTPGRILVTMTYRVVGSSASRLDAMAVAVDGVLGEQLDHLVQSTPANANKSAAPKGAAPVASQ
jgi:uncharacterized protein YndB with AHSA1/START domain